MDNSKASKSSILAVFVLCLPPMSRPGICAAVLAALLIALLSHHASLFECQLGFSPSASYKRRNAQAHGSDQLLFLPQERTRRDVAPHPE